ncbi:hypothetical protein B0H14DRAFT_2617109 [Mycena olivaceomarginata]|nr:hypothetical protein B0H14DRAFT_2617104 [Mycena olivaceomarginata]KAJ7799321.1 hypothetical protein B0H14DRAFT_2617109 [Mycena olivaceomarginata]
MSRVLTAVVSVTLQTKTRGLPEGATYGDPEARSREFIAQSVVRGRYPIQFFAEQTKLEMERAGGPDKVMEGADVEEGDGDEGDVEHCVLGKLSNIGTEARIPEIAHLSTAWPS